MGNAPLKEIEIAVNSIEKEKVAGFACKALAGDASDRRYFRASYKAGGKEKTVVVMDIFDVENICKSEEVTLYHDEKGELPFINIHGFLKEISAPVPNIYFFDGKNGLMLLEDMGDQQLLYQAEQGDKGKKEELYKKAIDVLIEMETAAMEKKKDSKCVAFDQTFAPKLLAWEFDHYLEYGVGALNNVAIESEEKAFLKEEFFKISSKIASMEKTFTHRDYHSRNLLVKDGRIFIIDFQDALFGPLAYDLASLLRDSYIDLGENLRDTLIKYYVREYRAARNKELDYVSFRKDFDLVAMQRNLKAAGRFVFIDQVKGNSSYLEAIPRTLGYVKESLPQNPDLAPIFEILGRYEKRFSE